MENVAFICYLFARCISCGILFPLSFFSMRCIAPICFFLLNRFFFPSKSCVNRFDLYLCIFCIYFGFNITLTMDHNKCMVFEPETQYRCGSSTNRDCSQSQTNWNKSLCTMPQSTFRLPERTWTKSKTSKWHRIRFVFRCVLLFGNVADESCCMAAIFVITNKFSLYKEVCAVVWVHYVSHIGDQRHLYVARRQNIPSMIFFWAISIPHRLPTTFTK